MIPEFLEKVEALRRVADSAVTNEVTITVIILNANLS